jgi:hypothetical protein
MNYFLDDIMKLVDEVSQFNEISSSEIPNIDLYMDQITTLFDNKLSHHKRNDEESILTKTMINNYAKAKILTPIKNKKYTKEQIMLLILIYNLKQTLSLDDIKLLLTPIINQLNSSTSSFNLEELYENFLKVKKDQNNNFTSTFLKDLDYEKSSINLEDSENLSTEHIILLVLTLINSANIQKRMAEKIIDTFFKNITSK